MGNNTFRDWIPAGEDAGAQGHVFTDFVPPAEPKIQKEITVEDIVAPQMFPCPTCEKSFSTKLALSGHSRSHK